MCDRPGPCYKYGKILILSRVLCSAGDTLMVSRGTGSDTGTIYVIKKVENILPYCVINKHQTLGNGASTSNQTLLSSFKFQHSSNQTLIRPAHLSSPFQTLHQQLHSVFGSTNMAIPAMSGIINSTSPGYNTGSAGMSITSTFHFLDMYIVNSISAYLSSGIWGITGSTLMGPTLRGPDGYPPSGC